MHQETLYLKNTHYDTIKDKDIFLYQATERDAIHHINAGRKNPVLVVSELTEFSQYLRDDRIPYSNDMPMDENTKKKIRHIISRTYIDMVNFQLFGKRPFLITENLTERLMNTNLNADCQFLSLPFPCTMFVYTNEYMIEAMYDAAGATNTENLKNPITVYLTQYTTESGTGKIRFDAYHPHKNHLALYAEDEIAITQDMTVSDYLATERPHLTGKKTDAEIFNLQEQQDAVLPEDSVPFMKTILNTILYLASAEPETRELLSQRQYAQEEANHKKNPAKKEKILSRAMQYSSLPYTVVGPNVQPITTQGQPGHTAWKLSVRFIVKGHWKNQPYGQAWSKRYLRWIEPYYKGPEMAEVINKPYLVK